jgi:hypothetical protein
MQLGDLIRRLQVESIAADALLALGDLSLLARVGDMAAKFGETQGKYVAASVGRFAATADDEAWLRLVGDVERPDDPGPAALKRMMLWALDDDTRGLAPSECGCGSGGGMCHDTG